MLEVIKMNKKHPFEAFRIPEDGIVDLVELSSWLGNNGVNMSSIKPGHYIIKDMDIRSSRVSIIDEETLYNSYDIGEKIIDEKVSSKMPSNLDLKGEFNNVYERLRYTRMLYLNCDNVHFNLTKGEHKSFELSDENDVKKPSGCEENKDDLNV